MEELFDFVIHEPRAVVGVVRDGGGENRANNRTLSRIAETDA